MSTPSSTDPSTGPVVWRVFRHDVTGGERDFGYPTTIPLGPLYAERSDAETDAEARNAEAHVRPARIRNERDEWVEVPRHFVEQVPVLSHEDVRERARTSAVAAAEKAAAASKAARSAARAAHAAEKLARERAASI